MQLTDEELERLLDAAAHRGALRQVPEQAGFPHNITWPEQPNG